MRILTSLCLFFSLFYYSAALSADTTFSQFAVDLPEGWDGEEKTGFVSENPDEYMLVLLRKDEAGEKILAQATIYILPNTKGLDAKDLASQMSEQQADTSELVQESCFWTFTGEPRSTTIKGQALNKASTSDGKMLIMIAQDPKNLGANDVLASLRGLNPTASSLLCGKK